MEYEETFDFTQIELQPLEIDDNQRERLISEIISSAEIDSFEENFWRSDYTESAVSYPSVTSSTEENVDYITQILSTEENANATPIYPRTSLNAITTVDPILQNFGYDLTNFNWETLMPAPVTPLIIPANTVE